MLILFLGQVALADKYDDLQEFIDFGRSLQGSQLPSDKLKRDFIDRWVHCALMEKKQEANYQFYVASLKRLQTSLRKKRNLESESLLQLTEQILVQMGKQEKIHFSPKAFILNLLQLELKNPEQIESTNINYLGASTTNKNSLSDNNNEEDSSLARSRDEIKNESQFEQRLLQLDSYE